MEPFITTVRVLRVGEIEHINRPGAPKLRKRVLKVVTIDGQILYPELRNRLLDSFDIQDIRVADTVKLQFCFQGSEKQGRQYNNIYVQKIDRLITA